MVSCTIDGRAEVDCDTGQEITAYAWAWFDVDRKFGAHTREAEIQGKKRLRKAEN